MVTVSPNQIIIITVVDSVNFLLKTGHLKFLALNISFASLAQIIFGYLGLWLHEFKRIRI